MNELSDMLVCLVSRKRPRLIGIDGPDCSGKSTLASSLAKKLNSRGAGCVLFHVDDLLTKRAYRERRGSWSVDAFLLDFFDYSYLVSEILRPHSEGDGLRVTIYPVDQITDEVKMTYTLEVNAEDLLLVEGLFLFEESRRDYFDLRIRLEVDEGTILQRAELRDVGRLGSAEWVKQHYTQQCIPAQRAYCALSNPAHVAHVIIETVNLCQPTIVKWRL